MKTIVLLIIGIMLSVCVSAQHRAVYGNVRLSDDLKLSNIVVKAKKAGTTTITDSLGNFVIVCNKKDVLQFEAKTFEKVSKRVRPSTDTVLVQMRFASGPESVQLAVGYGYISQDKATHAQSMLDNQRNEFCSYTNIFDLIDGRCAGVMVNNISTVPGGEQEVIIRGRNSIMLSNCALYVVDGVVVSQIADIAPCQVKSINILKDASASIYGSRGANGVILIETIK